MPTVFIPTMMRDLTGGVDRVEVAGTNVREAIESLDDQFPGLRDRLCRADALAPGLQVSIDNVMNSRGLRAKLGPHSAIHFIPAIGGG
ncbi:MAG: MoaD/ThiS family protein [Planctomycetales bacterium]|nr:MoaD/ThiS family protein [Planctomycetales bacterium]